MLKFYRVLTIDIRPYRPSDAIALARLYRRSVERIGPQYYSAVQVRAWASRAPSGDRLQALSTDGRIRLVATDDLDGAIAFVDLEPDGHIDFLYCAPEAIGRGVASVLYAELERIARQRGIRKLYAEASEAALGFFQKKGFTPIAKREFELSGTPIHNYAVEKILCEL